ncbi:MAG: hypothetical protein U0P81_14960 [Holophagaceae bacterium]
MADSSWNTPAPVRGRRRFRASWLLVPLALAAGVAALVFALVGRATGLRRQAWPLIQAVNARLATDEAARDLFRKNPLCAAGYASEEAFVEAARAWRSKGGGLPTQEPRDDRRGYTVESDPFELDVAIQGTGGGWMRARFATGPATQGQEAGEGLVRLVFADSYRGLQDAARDARRQARSREWEEFRRLTSALATDEGARDLFRSSPGLGRAWPSEEAFLQEIHGWRPHLAAIPARPDDGEKGDGEKGGGVQVGFSRHQSPLGSSVEIRVDHPGGRWKALWRDGLLADLRHLPRAAD